jgi:hypothetical protein
MPTSKWTNTVRGTTQIKADSITNEEIKSDAAIVETKLALDHSTQDLYEKALRTDESRTIENNVFVKFPATGFDIVCAETGKVYRFTCHLGVFQAVEV